jgi:hypothetical protein
MWLIHTRFRCRSLGLFVLSGALIAHAGVTPDLQHAMREGTFEVVIKKPQHDAVGKYKMISGSHSET